MAPLAVPAFGAQKWGSKNPLNRVCCKSFGDPAACFSAASILTFPQISFPSLKVEEEFIDEIYHIEYPEEENSQRKSRWLTEEYLDLRLRCSAIMAQESAQALERHFKNRKPAVKAEKPKFVKMESRTSDIRDCRFSQRGRRADQEQGNVLPHIKPENTVNFIKTYFLSDGRNDYFDDMPNAVNEDISFGFLLEAFR